MDDHRLQALRAQRELHTAQAEGGRARCEAEAAQAVAAARALGQSLAAATMTYPQMVDCVQQLEMLRQVAWVDHWVHSWEMLQQRYGWAVQPRRREEWVAFLEGVADVHALV